MKIRRAGQDDIAELDKLLYQVEMVHHVGRPDLFQPNCKKYTDAELAELLHDDTRPVFAAIGDDGHITGYAFCVLQDFADDNVRTGIKSIYIDDLCVDENSRGHHIGKQLYEYVLAYARSLGCYNVTLNVWSCNPGAMAFYESCGLVPYKVGMEKVL